MKILLFIQSILQQSVQSIATLIKVLLLTKSVKLPRKNHDEIIILGNGPSLNEFLNQHRDFLQNKDILAVNHFADTEIYQHIKPVYYLINVPEFWINNVDKDVLVNRNKLINNIIDKTNWQMNLILGAGARQSDIWQNIVTKNKNIKLYYINPVPVEGFRRFRYFCYRKNCGMPRPHNVLIPSLIAAINMDFKKIYIAGADHSWLPEIFVADDNTVYLTQRHFYDEKTARPDVMKKMGKNKRKLHEILHKFMLSFQAYFDINDYAKSRKSAIYNLTKGSYIDAFQRLKIKKNT
jgi:hypothetical protein